MSKIVMASLALALCLQTAFAARSLQQLPTLPGGSTDSTPGPVASPGPGPALAPSPSAPASCALLALQSSGQYSTLLQLVGASSQSALLTKTLNDASTLATVLAPTDAGIASAAQAAGISLSSLLADPQKITDILEYHILPSQLAVGDLKDGFSFNTNLAVNGVAQSVAVRGSGQTATIVGKSSSAPITGTISSACQFVIIPLNGLLLP